MVQIQIHNPVTHKLAAIGDEPKRRGVEKREILGASQVLHKHVEAQTQQEATTGSVAVVRPLLNIAHLALCAAPSTPC